jgi:hypothetical protein
MATQPLPSAPAAPLTPAMGEATTARTLGNEFLRTIWIFQAGCALPTLLILGAMAFIQVFEPQIPLYDFMSVSHVLHPHS